MTNKDKTTKRRIFLVDDHDVVRLGAARVIEREADLMICGEARSVGEAMPLIRKVCPDLVVADISLKNSNGLEMVKTLHAEFPKLCLLVMSMHDELIWAEVALRAGARGYIMKESSIETLIPAIRTVLEGQIFVSPAVSRRLMEAHLHNPKTAAMAPIDRLSGRELQVLQLLGQSKSSREISGELNISVKTVEYYKQNLKDKLNLKSAGELTRFALETLPASRRP
jgi:DNA-binding NarL/FixJ family response regulator